MATCFLLATDTCTDQHSCHLLMQHYDVCRYQDIASQFCELSCGLCRSSIACEDFISDCDKQSAVMGESMCMNYQVSYFTKSSGMGFPII